jgi:hypothetical protein
MPHSDFAKLYDSANGLTCHFVPVDDTTRDLAESVRDMFVASMNDYGYEGFSREIDNMFHLRSTYVYITEATKIVMTGRVTPRPPGTFVPFEMGVREDGGSYSLDDGEQVVDINTYTYVRGYYERATPLLLAGFGYCSKSFNARRAYCLYDVENEKIERAYLSIGFVFSKRFPELIHFPTFYKRKGDRLEPARWQVMEWDNETIEGQARIAVERYELVNGT